MNLAIVTTGILPYPPTKGGAVENLIDIFVLENEKNNDLNIRVFSIYDKDAKENNNFKNTNVIFIKPNIFARILDRIVYFFAQKVFKFKNMMSFRYIFSRLSYLNKVAKVLKKSTDIDKIVLENHPTTFLTLKKYKNYEKYKNRFYYHLHNEMKSTYKCEDLMKSACENICVSEYISNQFKEKICYKDGTNFTVLKNCINNSKFEKELLEEEKDQLKNSLNITKNDFVIVFAGRLTEEKGIKELLVASKNIKNKNYKILVVGNYYYSTKIKSKFLDELYDLIQDQKDKIIFTGYINYDEIYKYYKIADVAVLPSMWNEPAGLTVLEAMMSGLPIITTNSGGIPEYANEKCAFILERDDNLVYNISEKINLLMSDENLKNKMGAESLKEANNYKSEQYYEEFLKILGE